VCVCVCVCVRACVCVCVCVCVREFSAHPTVLAWGGRQCAALCSLSAVHHPHSQPGPNSVMPWRGTHGAMCWPTRTRCQIQPRGTGQWWGWWEYTRRPHPSEGPTFKAPEAHPTPPLPPPVGILKSLLNWLPPWASGFGRGGPGWARGDLPRHPLFLLNCGARGVYPDHLGRAVTPARGKSQARLAPGVSAKPWQVLQAITELAVRSTIITPTNGSYQPAPGHTPQTTLTQKAAVVYT